MAVLVEGISVIVKRRDIDTGFEGDWDSFLSVVPNATLCSDGELARVGFMSPGEVENFINELTARGLTLLQGGEAQQIAVVDQQRGPTTPCEWLEFGRLPIGGSESKVSACWLFEGPRIASGMHIRDTSMQLATPVGWEFDGSLSDKFFFGASTEEH